MSEIINDELIENNAFWNEAYQYASQTGEPEFVSEMAFIMTTLHAEGFE